MRFRTEYGPVRRVFTLDPACPVVLLGSCFADNMGSRMRSCLWEAENPLGTLYNPHSIASSLEAMLCEDGLRRFEDSLFKADGMWRSWLFDSRLSAETVEDVTYAFGEKKRKLQSLLERGEVLFVTFGTAWCYYLRRVEDMCPPGEPYLVANCHKQPSAIFERRRLSVEEIVERWREVIASLRRLYPQLRIVFTVSPVRHLKDGFEGNVRSKSILLLAVEELCRLVDECHYFPAYEIVNDDLRDYRFYAADLVHPSEEGVEYIWEIFKQMYIDNQGLRRLKEGEGIRKGLDHRPLPNATRCPSPEASERERARLDSLEERRRIFLRQRK